MIMLIISGIAALCLAGGRFTIKDVTEGSIKTLFLYPIFLLHNLVLYPKLLLHKKIALYACIMISSVFVCRLSYTFIFIHPLPVLTPIKLSGQALRDLLLTYEAFCVYLAFVYVKQKEKSMRIANMQKAIELKQLRMQLNPHFLFNALNNIYSYSLENNNTYSNNLLLRLKELLSYTIQNSQKEQILLYEELSFIENYIAFEQERLGTRCAVTFEKKTRHNVNVAPFILFSFIENAFKHGTDMIGRSAVNISVDSTPARLKLVVQNTVRKRPVSSSTQKGLANTVRRLELLYPGKYDLSLRETEAKFEVNMILKLE